MEWRERDGDGRAEEISRCIMGIIEQGRRHSLTHPWEGRGKKGVRDDDADVVRGEGMERAKVKVGGGKGSVTHKATKIRPTFLLARLLPSSRSQLKRALVAETRPTAAAAAAEQVAFTVNSSTRNLPKGRRKGRVNGKP